MPSIMFRISITAVLLAIVPLLCIPFIVHAHPVTTPYGYSPTKTGLRAMFDMRESRIYHQKAKPKPKKATGPQTTTCITLSQDQPPPKAPKLWYLVGIGDGALQLLDKCPVGVRK